MDRKEVGMGSYAQKGGGQDQLFKERRWTWLAMHRKKVGMASYSKKGGGHG